MSDEALNEHLDWLDKCAEERENETQVVGVEQGYLDWLERIAEDLRETIRAAKELG